MKSAQKNTHSANIQEKANAPFFQAKESEATANERTFFTKNDQAKPSFLNSTSSPTIQAKLTIGQPGDKYEREADAVADRVVKGDKLTTKNIAPKSNTPIQRECSECGKEEEEIQRKKLESSSLNLQFKCSECEEKETLLGLEEEKSGEAPDVEMKPIFESERNPLQDNTVQPKFHSYSGNDQIINTKQELPEISEELAQDEEKENAEIEENGKEEKMDSSSKAVKPKGSKESKFDIPLSSGEEEKTEISMKSGSSNSTPQVSSNFESKLSKSKGTGHKLDNGLRQEMEGQFGKDFCNVKIHSDSESVQMNQEIGARAFTNKNDIYFNENEYQPNSDSGKHLLAHELTHTVHQGASSDTVQRMEQPPEPIANPPAPEITDDGKPVLSNIEKIKDNDDRDEDDKPEKAEIRREGRALNASGETTPTIDRGKIAGEQSQEQKAEIEQQVNEPTESKEEESEETKVKINKSKGVNDAASAEKNKNLALNLKPPEFPKAFIHPKIEVPIDKEGDELPRDAVVDDSIRGLGHIAETYRNIGYQMQKAAYEKESASYALDGTLDKTREETAYAEEGVVIMEGNQQQRAKINKTAKKGLSESITRQKFVSEKSAEVEKESSEKRRESNKLKSDAASKANDSKNNPPDDEEARQDAKKQNADMDSTVEGTVSIDNAVKGANESAIKLGQEAQNAAENNIQTEGVIGETDEYLNQMATRIEEMRAKNAMSRSQIENSAGGPDKIREFARHNYQAGEDLIEVSNTMETDLTNLQDEYLAGSKEVPGLKEIENSGKKKAEEQRKSDSLIAELYDLSKLSEEEQEEYVNGMEEKRKTELLEKLKWIIDQDQQESTEGKGQKSGEEDLRESYYEIVKSIRSGRLIGVVKLADDNYDVLSATQKIMISQSIQSASIKDDIANIFSWKNFKKMLNPKEIALGLMKGPGDAISGIASGFKNFPEKWENDKIGAVLQIAADITTGLAKLFSSILAIVGIVAGILTIASIFFPPLFTPVPILGTIMSFCGKGALITGAYSLYFNRLTYLKNLYDVGASETSQGLLDNTQEMKKNTYDGLSGALAMVEGYGGMKMGAGLKSGGWKNAVLSHKTLKLRLAAAGTIFKQGLIHTVTAPIRLAKHIARIFGKGRQGLIQFWKYLRKLFGKKKSSKTDLDIDGGTSHKNNNSKEILDNTKNEQGKDLTSQEIKAEVDSFKEGKFKKSNDPDYDFEIEIENGHTWKRNKKGKWCRFSDPFCFTDADLPDEFPSEKELFDHLKKEGADLDSFDEWLEGKQTLPGGSGDIEPGLDITSDVRAGKKVKPTSGDWSQAPNWEKWTNKKNGRIIEHGDGSVTMITEDGIFVKYSPDGDPDFRRFMNHESGVTEIDIDKFVNDAADFKKANIKVSKPEWKSGAPDDWTWHHSRPPKTKLQLIPTKIHRIFGHTGKNYKPKI